MKPNKDTNIDDRSDSNADLSDLLDNKSEVMISQNESPNLLQIFHSIEKMDTGLKQIQNRSISTISEPSNHKSKY